MLLLAENMAAGILSLDGLEVILGVFASFEFFPFLCTALCPFCKGHMTMEEGQAEEHKKAMELI